MKKTTMALMAIISMELSAQNNTFPTPTGNVGIGSPGAPAAKLHVMDNVGMAGIFGSFRKIMTLAGSCGNNFQNNHWLVRSIDGNTWSSAALHDGISIDALYQSPGTNTKTWWERRPSMDLQTWGHDNVTHMTLNQGRLLIGQYNSNTLFSKTHISNEQDASLGSAYGRHHGLLVEQFITVGSSQQQVFGIRGEALTINPVHARAVGISGHAKVSSGSSIGGEGYAGGGSYSNGLHGQSKTTSSTNGFQPSQSIGIQAHAIGFAEGDAIGVQAFVSGENLRIKLAGLFWGDVAIDEDLEVDGDLDVVGVFNGSDRKLKDQIKPLTDATSKIMKLKPSTYIFKKDEEFKDMHLPEGEQMGLIAQDLETVFPTSVKEIKAKQFLNKEHKIGHSTPDYKGVNYISLIPLLIAGAQEQQVKIDQQLETNTNLKALVEKQQKELDELKAIVNSLAGNPVKAGTSTSVPVELSDKNVIVLDQNVPNPFAESTVISYSIPTDFTKAQIIFTNADGKLIKVINITEKGAGRLNVFGSDLSSGIYSYTLVIDGKNMEAKKMIKQ